MSYTFPDTQILIFTKPPLAGKCKSRLIPALGEEGAAELQARLLKKIIKDLSDFNLCPFEIWQSEESSYFSDSFREQKINISIYTQQGDTLGERMFNAMQMALQKVSNVIIIGADCVLYSQAYIKKAISYLGSVSSLVIGPATDGGYVLIGASQLFPSVFENINWGTNRVFEQTLLTAQNKGITCHILTELWDIDTPADLDKLREWAPDILTFPS